MVAAGLAGSQVVIAATLRTLAPETIVEQQDASSEPAQNKSWHAAKQQTFYWLKIHSAGPSNLINL